jgi:ABC-2 type transport system ATP-binding protein
LSTAIQILNLTKKFPVPKRYRDLLLSPFNRDEITALEDISFQVGEGELFGLLGPNGAGKTTLVKILCNMILPTSGKGFIFEHDVSKNSRAVKQIIGYVVSDERSFFWRLTGRQNLKFFAALNNMLSHQADTRIKDLVELVGLRDHIDKTFKTYSTGMKQKLAIARGLLSDPRILLLDEPTRALDPVATRNIRQFIKESIVGDSRKTVVIATNNMPEAEEMCDRVAIIDKGLVKICDTIPKIKEKITRRSNYVLIVNSDSEKTRQSIASGEPMPESVNLVSIHSTDDGARVIIEFDSQAIEPHKIIKYFYSLNLEINAFFPEEPSLDEVFSQLID